MAGQDHQWLQVGILAASAVGFLMAHLNTKDATTAADDLEKVKGWLSNHSTMIAHLQNDTAALLATVFPKEGATVEKIETGVQTDVTDLLNALQQGLTAPQTPVQAATGPEAPPDASPAS